MAWVYLFIAGLLEIGWAVGLKYTHGFTRLLPSVLTLVAMAGSRRDGVKHVYPSELPIRAKLRVR